jgi:hypothetical protein
MQIYINFTSKKVVSENSATALVVKFQNTHTQGLLVFSAQISVSHMIPEPKRLGSEMSPAAQSFILL